MDWIKTIKVTAQGLEIWEYMDPEVEPENIPVLSQPARPSPRSGTTSVDSTDLELFKYDLKEWSERKTALKKIPKEILQTIDRTCINFIQDSSSSSPYQMLRDLRAKLKPDNAVHKNILTKKWK